MKKKKNYRLEQSKRRDYTKAFELRSQGRTIKSIANELNIPYETLVYQFARQRKLLEPKPKVWRPKEFDGILPMGIIL